MREATRSRSDRLIGHTLAHYRTLSKLGAGGMGEVYVADDTKLGRRVALKILPPEVASDSDRRARFSREAKAIAALNHTNIVTVYSVEQAGDIHFITMELVNGRTLAAILPHDGLPLDRFFEIAIALADAIAAAHQQGIVHRDLKPTNLMIGDDGRIKVLDFGLATGAAGQATTASDAPTLTATREGLIRGTPAYMSPEQARGEAVDPRSDMFSLGIHPIRRPAWKYQRAIRRRQPVSVLHLAGRRGRHLGDERRNERPLTSWERHRSFAMSQTLASMAVEPRPRAIMTG